jgi:glycosyltransferase involved in cell wall biosynthesis
MRFVVAQIGARRGYAVPAILEKAGMLETFYTDVTANAGLSKWLAKCGYLSPSKSAAAKFSGRRVPESIRGKTSTFPWRAFWFACRRVLSCSDPASRFRQQLHCSSALGFAMARHGFGKATHLYSMLGECGPLLRQAKRQGLIVVSEIYILLSTERILEAERRAFPDWESGQPDFEGIRGEFADSNALLTHSDFAVCPSEAVRTDLEEKFGFRRGHSAVVPYGLDPKWLELSPRPRSGRVLFVGTADLRKGIHYLAMASRRLRADDPYYEFRIAGNVAPRIANQPACRHLTFLGRIPRDRIHEEYSGADVLVLPSLAEGSAEVTYEALAMGIPVITTAAAGSVVRDGIEGRIVPERDHNALAEAIQQIVRNRELRDRMSARARARAREYTLERYAQRLLAALSSFKP